MNQLQKYTWLINTIRRAGEISLKDLSDEWERSKELSDYKPLLRATFNRWRDAIFDQFGIIIDCKTVGGYKYYIANPEDIDEDKLKKWMLDSFAVGNLLGENLSLKDRIIVDEIPSGREHLTKILEAMKENHVVNITYQPFSKNKGYTFPIEPYCVKLFENRWYVLARNVDYNDIRLYALDRMLDSEILSTTFRLPKKFDAHQYFANSYGIVVEKKEKPVKIILRANQDHKHYLKSLPLHHSQKLIEDCGEYADFELYLIPSYDFVLKLLQVGSMVEVIQPVELRKTMKGWTREMYELYQND